MKTNNRISLEHSVQVYYITFSKIRCLSESVVAKDGEASKGRGEGGGVRGRKEIGSVPGAM